MSVPCRLFDNSFINQHYYMKRLRCDLPLIQTTSNQTLHFLASSAVHLPSVMLMVILMNGYCVNLDLTFSFRGGSPASTGEDGCFAYSLLCAEFEQSGRAAETGTSA